MEGKHLKLEIKHSNLLNLRRIIPWSTSVLRGGRPLLWKTNPVMNTIPLSRENMEALLRRLVLKQPNVKQISGRVIGLIGDSKILTGVKIRTAAEEDTEISADLVVGE